MDEHTTRYDYAKNLEADLIIELEAYNINYN
jgi:hypothetical protein